MGLDIYAGTLTRYYAHNWKSAVQQWAEANGYTFQRVTPEGEQVEEETELDPAEIQDCRELARSSDRGHLSAGPGALSALAGGQRAPLLHR